MKTKLLKVSKCTLSLVLSLMMLFSSVFVSSGVTTTITAADTPDTTAADTAEDTAQADDTSAPQKSAAPAKVTPQASGVASAGWYVDGGYGLSGWNSGSSNHTAHKFTSVTTTLFKYETGRTLQQLYDGTYVENNTTKTEGNKYFRFVYSNGSSDTTYKSQYSYKGNASDSDNRYITTIHNLTASKIMPFIMMM